MSWLSAAWRWYATEVPGSDGSIYPHASLVNPVVAGIGAALLIAAALQQAATAQRRHREQTSADRQRRIIESFSKATEQLGSGVIVVRLGGIYTLERISRESPDDYWTVMETLCAFVRERTRMIDAIKRDGPFDSNVFDVRDTPTGTPPTDTAAVLTVIVRREKTNQERETAMKWCLDFRNADLSWADLSDAYLRHANFCKARLTGANFGGADIRGANFSGAEMGGMYLGGVQADGDTVLPDNIKRPSSWPPPNPPVESSPTSRIRMF